MADINLNSGYESFKRKRCSVIYMSPYSYPRYVEVYNDNSWAAYNVSYHCVPERTGKSTDDFSYAYPQAVMQSAVRKPAATCEPKYFVDTLNANVNNVHMNDEEFREFVRRTLPIYTVKQS